MIEHVSQIYNRRALVLWTMSSKKFLGPEGGIITLTDDNESSQT